MDWLEWGYWGLLAASFLSATIVPLASEAVLAGMLYGGADPVMCILIATAGNWAGGMSTYWIGHLGRWEWIERYFRTPREKVEEWKPRIDRWGSLFALLSFLPLVGDIIVLALGFFRAHTVLTAWWMLVGKLGRYLVVYWGMGWA